MSAFKVSRDTRISLIEECWLQCDLGNEPVELHIKLYRADAGQYYGKFGAAGFLGKAGGGYAMITSSPYIERVDWANSKEEAIEKLVARLEARDDLKA